MAARIERVWTPGIEEHAGVAGSAVPPEGTASPDLPAGQATVAEANAWLIGDEDEVFVIDPG